MADETSRKAQLTLEHITRAVKAFDAKKGKPGAILIAREIDPDNKKLLSILRTRAKTEGFISQLNSFLAMSPIVRQGTDTVDPEEARIMGLTKLGLSIESYRLGLHTATPELIALNQDLTNVNFAVYKILENMRILSVIPLILNDLKTAQVVKQQA